MKPFCLGSLRSSEALFAFSLAVFDRESKTTLRRFVDCCCSPACLDCFKGLRNACCLPKATGGGGSVWPGRGQSGTRASGHAQTSDFLRLRLKSEVQKWIRAGWNLGPRIPASGRSLIAACFVVWRCCCYITNLK